MRKYFLAAALATAPMLATTGAHAITVQQGSELEITVSGDYSVNDGGDLDVGSVLTLSDIFVVGINQTNPSGIDLDGLTQFSTVTPSPTFTLGNSSNNGVTFAFDATPDSEFVLDQSFGAFVGTGGNGSSSLFGSGTLENDGSAPGSYSWATTSNNETGNFQLSFAVPPEFTPPPEVIPLPAAAWLLLGALGSLLAFRRYKSA